MAGLRFLSRASDGSIVLASYHPTGCPTWHWSVSLKRGDRWAATGFSIKAKNRTAQWHDVYRLPFGWALLVSRQDYHLGCPHAPE